MKMINRRSLLATSAAFAAMLVLSETSARAETKFTLEALEAAQKAGKSILVEVAAPWCPTCKAQQPIIEWLAKDAKFKDFVFLKLDFDSQKDELRKLNARNQSTLIVFKGTNEVGRSVGDTNPDSIEALLAKAL
jgi:thiol-disulfide isomerase/thioredoxin